MVHNPSFNKPRLKRIDDLEKDVSAHCLPFKFPGPSYGLSCYSCDRCLPFRGVQVLKICPADANSCLTERIFDEEGQPRGRSISGFAAILKSPYTVLTVSIIKGPSSSLVLLGDTFAIRYKPCNLSAPIIAVR